MSRDALRVVSEEDLGVVARTLLSSAVGSGPKASSSSAHMHTRSFRAHTQLHTQLHLLCLTHARTST